MPGELCFSQYLAFYQNIRIVCADTNPSRYAAKLEVVTLNVPLNSAQLAEAKGMFEAVVVPVMALDHHEDPKSEERQGAFLDIRDYQNNEQLHTRSGDAAHKKFSGYSENATDKNDALEDNPEHRTSFEVHRGDTSMKPYPGAIRSDHDDRIAISGFSWQRDTIACLWLAWKLGRIAIKAVFEIAEICGIKDDCQRLFLKLNKAEKALA